MLRPGLERVFKCRHRSLEFRLQPANQGDSLATDRLKAELQHFEDTLLDGAWPGQLVCPRSVDGQQVAAGTQRTDARLGGGWRGPWEGEAGAKEKDHDMMVHHHIMISILKRDSECPALPACLYAIYRHNRPEAWSRFCGLFRFFAVPAPLYAASGPRVRSS